MTDTVCVNRSDLETLLRLAGHIPEHYDEHAAVERCRVALYPPPALVPTPAPTATFEQFWLAYGKKVGRKTAKAAWDRAMKAGHDAAMIVAAAHEYRQFCLRPNTPNQAHPTTWLNQERWDDELEEWAPQRQSRGDRADGAVKEGIVRSVEGLSFKERLAIAGVAGPKAIGSGT